VSDPDDVRLLYLAFFAGSGFLLVLGHLREEFVAIGFGSLESLGFSTERLVREVLLVIFGPVSDADIKSVVLLFGLIDPGDAVVRAWFCPGRRRVELTSPDTRKVCLGCLLW